MKFRYDLMFLSLFAFIISDVVVLSGYDKRLDKMDEQIKELTVVEEVVDNVEEVIELADLGEYKLTAYCPCVKCCGKSDGITATGVKAKSGRTVAVDPNVIPLGSEIIIDGICYTAEDVGGAVKGNVIDIFFDTHEEALQFGVQYKDVNIIVG